MTKDITKIKQIRLIAADFNDVNSKELTRRQYINNHSCPLANAFKRMGFNWVNVGGETATLNDKNIVVNFDKYDLEKRRLRLVNGAKYAIVKLHV